jgi:hypothetical protein
VDGEYVEYTRSSFRNEGEARAFADGLTYGDEPQWAVDAIEQCSLVEGQWDVVFAYADDVSFLPEDPEPTEHAHY